MLTVKRHPRALDLQVAFDYPKTREMLRGPVCRALPDLLELGVFTVSLTKVTLPNGLSRGVRCLQLQPCGKTGRRRERRNHALGAE